jgi:transaldolase
LDWVGASAERREDPILLCQDGRRPDRRTAHRWVQSIGQPAGLGLVHPHILHASYRSLLSEERWTRLAAAGARPQRPLWASTSTKDPTFPDTYYLGQLATPDTIDTVPEKTLLAFADHGGPVDLMDPDYAAAARCTAEIASHGIDIDALAESLQREGARAFEGEWSSLLDAIAAKARRLRAMGLS